MAYLKHLFQPIKIGSMEVPNRLVMPPHHPVFGVEEGHITPQIIAYWTERARSQPGMMSVPSALVRPSEDYRASVNIKFADVNDDRFIPSLERAAKAVKECGVKFGVELTFMPLEAHPGPTVGPSNPPFLQAVGFEIRELRADEVRAFVLAFGAGAERCMRAGFDFVEIEAAHGHLVAAFLSPFYNQRTDEYGGSFENRIRFLLEIIQSVRGQVGDQYPLGVRIVGDDFADGGWGPSDLYRIAPVLENHGVDYLSIAVSEEVKSGHREIAPMYEPQGSFVYLSEEVKKLVSIPVITGQRIKDPVMADSLIGEGKADMVAMARAQIADPGLAQKAREGRIADIRPCLADCRGCIDKGLNRQPITCTVNPRVGREYLLPDEVEGEKHSQARKVLVAGGGPAGMEAARRAAFSGHQVTLCESRAWLGGQLKLAATMPGRQEMGDILPWYERQLHELGVRVMLNTTIDETKLDELSPDVVIVATGSLPQMPQGLIHGLENIETIEPMMADELIEEEKLTGDTVLVVGGDHIGLQLLDYLTEKGKRVYIAQRGSAFAEKMAYNDRAYLEERLQGRNIKWFTEVERIEIMPGETIQVGTVNGTEDVPDVEALVFAGERRPIRFLAEIAERKGIETHIIGDASGVAVDDQGTVLAAIATGYDVGRQV